MRRREFIGLLGSAAVAWPLSARAQQPERMRRIGVVMLYNENDPAGQERAAAFRQRLEKLGWTQGRNVQLDFEWGIGDADWIGSAAARLVALAPDVIIVNSGTAVPPVQRATRTIPIIFIGSTDPVAQGLVQSLAHPGGNTTGFTVLVPDQGAKLLALLKELVPRLRRVLLLVSPDNSGSQILANQHVWGARRSRSRSPLLLSGRDRQSNFSDCE